ncbi:MAG: hypothetical protein M9897_09295 [Brumimicrobium sp.]|nr:hypothetical protein [Brumimicrobium sp.]
MNGVYSFQSPKKQLKMLFHHRNIIRENTMPIAPKTISSSIITQASSNLIVSSIFFILALLASFSKKWGWVFFVPDFMYI